MSRARRLLRGGEEDSDPLSGMANMFDLGMVFAVALMVALVTRLQVSDLLTRDKASIVKNPGQPDMEIVVKDGQKITRYKAGSETTTSDGSKGRKVGIAYELEDGQVIYVPETP